MNTTKRPRSLTLDGLELSNPIVNSNHQPKKIKISPSPTVSPFPDFVHPTSTEAHQVFDLLRKEFPSHDDYSTRKDPSIDNNSASTCGNVPNVIESLIGTILSQNTTAKNSTEAKRSLDAAFGRNDFAAIAAARRGEVVEAIKHGGLANKKAATIQNLLASIHARHGSYSLQHLAEEGCSDEDAMEELTSYAGVGPKTASCVLLFCLGRESFPVDTHVFRLSKVLGWLPKIAAINRVSAQEHLDVRIPKHLKYGLHVLMVSHGRKCSGCKDHRAKGACSLKSYLKERKGVDEQVGEEVGQTLDESS